MQVTAVTAITWVFALLLAAAGVAKVTSPAATGAALQTAKLPADHRLVRLLGVYELALAAVVLLVGGTVPAALLAVTYVAFAAFAFRQSRRGEGCGCFGEAATPTGNIHVLVNVAAASCAAATALGPARSLLTAVEQPLHALVATVLLVTATGVVRLLLTAVPDLAAARGLLVAESQQT